MGTHLNKSNVSLICAPYSPVGSGEIVHLGAARKIELVVCAIAGVTNRILFVNSAHNERRFSRSRVRRRWLGGVHVVEVAPPLFPSRKLGKLLNVMWVIMFAWRMRSREIKVFWLYNAYIFEAVFALAARITARLKVVEVEDWPGARRGRFSIKNWLDRWGLIRCIRWADIVYAVNEDVAASSRSSGARHVVVFPGLVKDVSETRFGVECKGNRRVIGYCGGLSVEKGCDVLVRLTDSLPHGWMLRIAGFGPMSASLAALAKDHSSFDFLGPLSQLQLEEFMRSCDVLVNPHSDISAMLSGVFPFKVIDYLSSGALVLSTPLPRVDVAINNAVVLIDATPESIAAALNTFELNRGEIESKLRLARNVIKGRYSVPGLTAQLLSFLSDSRQAGFHEV